MGRTRTELTKGGQFFVEGLNDEELNFFNALMSSPKDLSDQVNNVKTEVVKQSKKITVNGIFQESQYCVIFYFMEGEAQTRRKIYYRVVKEDPGFVLVQSLIPHFERFNLVFEGQIVTPRLSSNGYQ